MKKKTMKADKSELDIPPLLNPPLHLNCAFISVFISTMVFVYLPRLSPSAVAVFLSPRKETYWHDVQSATLPHHHWNVTVARARKGCRCCLKRSDQQICSRERDTFGYSYCVDIFLPRLNIITHSRNERPIKPSIQENDCWQRPVGYLPGYLSTPFWSYSHLSGKYSFPCRWSCLPFCLLDKLARWRTVI